MINIIIVSDKLSKTKTLSTAQSILLVFGLVLLPVLSVLAVFVYSPSPIKPQNIAETYTLQAKKIANNSQSHLDAYAKQIGELQARILRLDAQNSRLAKLAGIKMPAHMQSSQTNLRDLPDPNRGGPLLHPTPMSELDLKSTIAELVRDLDLRDEHQDSVEANLLQQSVYKGMLPNISPIEAGYRSSSYGWRIDPFTGYKHFHEGLDFPAPIGTPVYAAADGIASAIEVGGAYGNLLKVEHGAGLSTYYAHNSRILVKVGEKVNKGQKIALVGNTGRSTGSHLHYEIRLNGNPLDPSKYLYGRAR